MIYGTQVKWDYFVYYNIVCFTGLQNTYYVLIKKVKYVKLFRVYRDLIQDIYIFYTLKSIIKYNFK